MYNSAREFAYFNIVDKIQLFENGNSSNCEVSVNVIIIFKEARTILYFLQFINKLLIGKMCEFALEHFFNKIFGAFEIFIFVAFSGQ